MVSRNLIGAGIGAAIALSASQAFAACEADVKTVTDNGGGNITVTYSTHVTSSGQDLGPWRDYQASFTGASVNDIAAIRALHGGRPEGSGVDYNDNLPLNTRKDNACEQAVRQANGRLRDVIARTADPAPVVQREEPTPRVEAVPPAGTQHLPVIKPRHTTPERTCTIPAIRVIQLGIPCNCENAQREAQELADQIRARFPGQFDQVQIYTNTNLSRDNGTQITVGVTDIIGNQPRFQPAQTFIVAGGEPQTNGAGFTPLTYIQAALTAAGAKPTPQTLRGAACPSR